jgi:beta-glucosidase/6-phospho-beta-glucosidase/beta-galactosidase
MPPHLCRLSLSWTRILPGGGRGTAPSAAGLRFYTSLLQELRAAGVMPVVTLFHFDLPQVLQVCVVVCLTRVGSIATRHAHMLPAGTHITRHMYCLRVAK